MTFLEYYLNKNTKNYACYLSITYVSFSLSFLLISPGKQTFAKAEIISFLLDCLINVFFLYFGYIFGY